MRERGQPRLTGAVVKLMLCGRGVAAAGNDGRRAGWGVYPRAKTAPRRHGCRRPRPAMWQALGGIEGGCHTGDMKTAASATGTQGACDAASGALAAVMPLRQTRGGDRTGQDDGRLPPSASDWHRPARAATRALLIIFRATPCGRPVPDSGMACEARAVRVSAQHCSWQPVEAQRRGCHTGDVKSGGGPATATPQQACAVRMACGRPSGVMQPRNVRR